jgi:hypothetical protein
MYTFMYTLYVFMYTFMYNLCIYVYFMYLCILLCILDVFMYTFMYICFMYLFNGITCNEKEIDRCKYLGQLPGSIKLKFCP